jgi:hypothetical protein
MFLSWLRRLRQRPARPTPRGRRPGCRPRLEALEARWLLSGDSSPVTVSSPLPAQALTDAPRDVVALPVLTAAGLPSSDVVATFTPTGDISEVQATIAWSDGSQAAVALVSRGNGRVAVISSATYAAPGTYTFTVTLTASGGGTAVVQGTATVLPQGALNVPFNGAVVAGVPGGGTPSGDVVFREVNQRLLGSTGGSVYVANIDRNASSAAGGRASPVRPDASPAPAAFGAVRVLFAGNDSGSSRRPGDPAAPPPNVNVARPNPPPTLTGSSAGDPHLPGSQPYVALSPFPAVGGVPAPAGAERATTAAANDAARRQFLYGEGPEASLAVLAVALQSGREGEGVPIPEGAQLEAGPPPLQPDRVASAVPSGSGATPGGPEEEDGPVGSSAGRGVAGRLFCLALIGLCAGSVWRGFAPPGPGDRRGGPGGPEGAAGC